MASNPRKRRRSRELPPDLTELKLKLAEEGTSFIQQFSSSEPRMTKIVDEFKKISDDIKKMQRTTDTVRYYGATGAGLVMVVSLVAAPFTAGLSLAAIGATAVVAANITKMMSESGGAKKVEELGNEFLAIVEPMKKSLEEIKAMCEKSKEKISAETQADNSLTDVEELQTFLRRVSELKEKSAGVLIESASMQYAISHLLTLIVNIFRVIATSENDKKLEEAIIQSADQSKKVVKEFNEMKNELVEFTERIETTL